MDLHIERIHFDSNFGEKFLPKLHKFYFKAIFAQVGIWAGYNTWTRPVADRGMDQDIFTIGLYTDWLSLLIFYLAHFIIIIQYPTTLPTLKDVI